LRNHTNWSATTAEDFIADNGPVRAIGEHIFERFQYDSPDSGSFRQESIRYEGIQDGNMWTDCKVQESFTMSIRKVEDSPDLIAEMIQDTRNLSTKPACIAAATSGKGKFGTMKTIFRMVRTGD
jgi:hypothetical protein